MTQLPFTPDSPPSHQAQPPNDTTHFLALPTEIHTLIASQLTYPDLLSLTLAHPLFATHPHIYTTKTARVNWLLSRATQHLPLPGKTRCHWSSDREFVSNVEVESILRRRRLHAECADVWEKGHSAGECLVLGGKGRCQFIDEKDVTKDARWIRRATRNFGSLQGYVVEVRSGMRRRSGVVDVMRSPRMVTALVAVVACVLYLFV